MVAVRVHLLNGFNSAITNKENQLSSSKALSIKQMCDSNDYEFVPHNVNYYKKSDVVEFIENVKTMVFEQKKTVSDCVEVFIGTSLGGLMASYMANYFKEDGAKAVLINPSIDSNGFGSLKENVGQYIENYTTEEKHYLDNSILEILENISNDVLESFNQKVNSETCVYLDLGDDVLDSEKTTQFLNDQVEVHKFEGGSHRFDHIEEATKTIVPFINK